MSNTIDINDKDIYLERMSKPLQEKLKVANYFGAETTSVLDVGCADGTVTMALAKMLPDIEFIGIDLDKEFIEIAKNRAKEENIKNVTFESMYLRDLLQRDKKYSIVVFMSVLHEFYSYGEGISSVLKALADAHELLEKDGRIIIRDMILSEYTKYSKFNVEGALKKVEARKELTTYLEDFKSSFGEVNSVYNLNHFLLKYLYTENWDRESREDYVPVTFEQYREIFALLDMSIEYVDSYLIPFLKNKWSEDFGLTEHELSNLISTGIIVTTKK